MDGVVGIEAIVDAWARYRHRFRNAEVLVDAAGIEPASALEPIVPTGR